MVKFQHVSVGYPGREVLQGVTFTAPRGKVTSLIGPNGCGKTTLLKAACGLLPPLSGEITLDGRPLSSLHRKERARLCGLLPQMREAPAIHVEGLVAHGRYPHLAFGRDLTEKDKELVRWAMEETGVFHLRQRPLGQLSGGERQRVYLSMALAQDPAVFFLDEPTTYLDIGQKYEMLGLVSRLRGRGKTVVMVLHDLPLAFAYSDYVAVFEGGRLLDFGESGAVFHGGAPEKAFGVACREITLDGHTEYLFTRS